MSLPLPVFTVVVEAAVAVTVILSLPFVPEIVVMCSIPRCTAGVGIAALDLNAAMLTAGCGPVKSACRCH
jgi:hypothetical protein